MSAPVSESRLRRAVERYNEYRSPMATATLLDWGPDGFAVRFEGPFCTTCCRDDYFDDLRYELDDLGTPADSLAVADVERVGPEAFEVRFT